MDERGPRDDMGEPDSDGSGRRQGPRESENHHDCGPGQRVRRDLELRHIARHTEQSNELRR